MNGEITPKTPVQKSGSTSVIATWLIMARLFHISSLAAITAAILTPMYTWWLGLAPEAVAVLFLMMVILLWRHRTNIVHIYRGTEGKIGEN